MNRNLPLLLTALGLYLGLYQGNLALWDRDRPEPLAVFPYRAALYPEADRQALARGIEISSSEELNKLLQDYLS